MRFWDELSPPWQACMDLAWEAYCDDCVPFGRLLFDSGVLSEARRRACDTPNMLDLVVEKSQL
jgi:hypothetical protein